MYCRLCKPHSDRTTSLHPCSGRARAWTIQNEWTGLYSDNRLWMLKLNVHRMFTCHRILFFFFPQPFKNVHSILTHRPYRHRQALTLAFRPPLTRACCWFQAHCGQNPLSFFLDNGTVLKRNFKSLLSFDPSCLPLLWSSHKGKTALLCPRSRVYLGATTWWEKRIHHWLTLPAWRRGKEEGGWTHRRGNTQVKTVYGGLQSA